MKKILTILITGLLVGCVATKPRLNFNDELTFGHINKVVAFEKKNGSIDRSPNHMIRLGDTIYPNNQNYELGKPRIFERSEDYFNNQISYYYSIPDSSVKVILYQWDKKDQKSFEDKSEKEEKFEKFKNKWNELVRILTDDFGQPTHMNIESIKYGDTVIIEQKSLEDMLTNIGNDSEEENSSWRDDMKWKSTTGIDAYMFMFGDNRTGYRQIRLSVYRE